MPSNISDKQLAAEQEQLLYRNSAGSLLASVMAALFICWFLRNSVESKLLILWLTSYLAIISGRLYLIHKVIRNSPRRQPIQHNLQAFAIGAYLTAIMWSTAAIMLFPVDEPMSTAILLIALISIAAVAIASLCPTWTLVATYLSLILLPISIKLLLHPINTSPFFAIFILIFWFISLVAAKKLNRTITENIILRLQSTEDQTKRELSEERYRHLFDNSPMGIVHFDNQGIIYDVNAIFTEILQLPQSGTGPENIIDFFKDENFKKELQNCLKSGEGLFEGEYRIEESGEHIQIRINLKAIRGIENRITGGIGSLEDISQQKIYEKQIEHQSSHDLLTGLPNKLFLTRQLQREISRSSRHTQMGALLFFDLDNFKTINDSLGHQAGDLLLKKVAERISTHLRKEDILARISGDEFAVLLTHLKPEARHAVQGAQDVAKKLLQTMSEPFSIEGQELNITQSFGISLFPENSKNAADIYKQASTAMNTAKESGKNTIRFFHPDMQEAADIRLRLTNDIRKAIANNELSLYFQPQVKADGTIVGAEALIRWIHPERGFIPPGDFISAAEETNIILEIGDWVLNTACRTIKVWEQADLLHENHTIAVNISAKEFSTPDFVTRVISTIENHKIEPKHLDIELTEGSLISSVSETIKKIQTLRDYGVRFSVDDFGTGYSSLSYLNSLPLHTLKIDRSFINDIEAQKSDFLLVEIILHMAQKLGLNTVAEGVENKEQLAYLLQRDCEVYQGYYFSKPIPLPEFGELLKLGRISI